MPRNLVRRPDGKYINAGQPRGMLLVCATGCCCGHTDKGFAAVPTDLYHREWERRKLRNVIHLNQGGCLGPCQLANVALLVFDGQPLWFHSLNTPDLVVHLYDYLETLVQADAFLTPPAPLADLRFNGFAWGTPATSTPTQHQRWGRRVPSWLRWNRRTAGEEQAPTLPLPGKKLPLG